MLHKFKEINQSHWILLLLTNQSALFQRSIGSYAMLKFVFDLIIPVVGFKLWTFSKGSNPSTK